MKLWILPIFCNLILAQKLCPILQTDRVNPCTDACVQEMEKAVFDSMDAPDYRNYVKEKFEEFIWSDCHGCIYIYCSLVHKTYGITLANEICRF